MMRKKHFRLTLISTNNFEFLELAHTLLAVVLGLSWLLALSLSHGGGVIATGKSHTDDTLLLSHCQRCFVE